MNVTLVGFTKKGMRKDVPVQQAGAVIGRTPEADIQIPVSDVSRRHCQIAVVGGKVKLKDLGSSNGTFVNDVKVAETTLRPGDRLRVGPFTFVVQIDGQPKDIKTIASSPAKASPAEATTQTGHGAGSKAKPAKDDEEFDLDNLDVEDLDEVDLDELSPIGDLDELEEIDSDELEELDDSDLIKDVDKPKGKK
jgi:pSer/pThr/pTyr-binding forkhead associated (FHA) protein